jgi:hypothetical protein
VKLTRLAVVNPSLASGFSCFIGSRPAAQAVAKQLIELIGTEVTSDVREFDN